ncbi:MAG: hypothetical protein KKF41_11305 [Actinobacteria bacterium]|nr:hypothetical protein [Actinomycetota bacterium]MBU1944363.1 hypothetical protein [Actinomycetota bacterium]MBU2688162.1 hypothetical protein [Actinomycetota bacterium]
MIRDPEYLEWSVGEFQRRETLSTKQRFALADAMWAEGVSLGVLPPADLLEGIEVDLRIARVLNSCSKRY